MIEHIKDETVMIRSDIGSIQNVINSFDVSVVYLLHESSTSRSKFCA